MSTDSSQKSTATSEHKYPSSLLQKLALIPCDHFWLEVKTSGQVVTAICKFRGCQQRMRFSMEEWGELAQVGRALNKPVRV